MKATPTTIPITRKRAVIRVIPIQTGELQVCDPPESGWERKPRQHLSVIWTLGMPARKF